MNKLIKYFKRVDGQSLAEFAVTTAMMATLATTAAPKFSGVGEGAKEKKTLSDIDKILKSANNFYNEQVTKSGRGRFPGQAKYNSPVPTGGGYAFTGDDDQTDAELNVKTDLVGVDGNNDGDYNDQKIQLHHLFLTTIPLRLVFGLLFLALIMLTLKCQADLQLVL